MELPKAILDTSALIYLWHLNLLGELKLFYDEVRLPSEVEREFIQKARSEEEKTERNRFLSEFLHENDSWFFQCQEYGEDLIQLYLTEPKMDRGEAEALAQNQFYDNGYEVIIDEKIARKMARSNSMKVKGTLALLAHLDQAFGLCDYHISVDILRVEIKARFGDKIIREVYEIVRTELKAN